MSVVGLTIQDVQSNTWIKLNGLYLQRLQNLREQNDGEMDEERRNRHIGRIAEVKALLAMGDNPAKAS